MTDSGPDGGAVLVTVAEVEELRAEAEFAEKNGWWACLENAGEASLARFETIMKSQMALIDGVSGGEMDFGWDAEFAPYLVFIVVVIPSAPLLIRDRIWWAVQHAKLHGWWLPKSKSWLLDFCRKLWFRLGPRPQT